MRRTKIVAFNGGGVLPQYHGCGGNALLYTEMEKTIQKFNYDQGEFTQIAESAVQMRKDIATLGGVEYKNHRVYQCVIYKKNHQPDYGDSLIISCAHD